MEKTKLIKVFQSLSKKELKEFGQFLETDLFNKNEKVVLLFNYLKKFAPHFNSYELKKEIVFKAIFNEDKYNDQKMFDICSEIIKIFKKFICIKKYMENDIARNINILDFLLERGILSHFSRTVHQTADMLNGTFDSDEKNLYDKLQFNRILYNNQGENEAYAYYAYNTTLQKMSNYLDEFFMISKLKLFYTMLQSKQYYAAEYRTDFLDEIEMFVTKNKESVSPIVRIYRELIKTLTSEDHNTHFNEARRLTKWYENKIDADTLYLIYANLQDYCVNRINEGKDEYEGLLFDLYKKFLSLENASGLENVRHLFYKNIVTLALRLNEIEWAKDFTEKYKAKLPKKLQENAYRFNSAKIFFKNKKYNEALKTLRRVEYSDIFYNLEAKGVLIMIYYELSEFDGLEFTVDAFKHFLRRNRQVPAKLRQSGYNFIKFVKRIARIKLDNKGSGQVVKNELLESRLVANKKWLLEKVEELNG